MIIKKAYGKINLTLEVSKRRYNNLHMIKSIMQNISIYDTLKFKKNKSSEIILKCDNKNLSIGKDNLIIKSAKYLQMYSSCTKGACIELKKRIPISSGLGGGSSDAAATLLALNDLWRTNISVEKLKSISINIGSDVPFFLIGNTCLVEGIGEHITPIPTINFKRIILITPPFSVKTKSVYTYYDKILKFKKNKKIKFDTDRCIRDLYLKKDITSKYFFNDLEAATHYLYPDIKNYIKYLKSKSEKILMAGSGASFVVFNPDPNIKYIYNKLKEKGAVIQIINSVHNY